MSLTEQLFRPRDRIPAGTEVAEELRAYNRGVDAAAGAGGAAVSAACCRSRSGGSGRRNGLGTGAAGHSAKRRRSGPAAASREDDESNAVQASKAVWSLHKGKSRCELQSISDENLCLRAAAEEAAVAARSRVEEIIEGGVGSQCAGVTARAKRAL